MVVPLCGKAYAQADEKAEICVKWWETSIIRLEISDHIPGKA